MALLAPGSAQGGLYGVDGELPSINYFSLLFCQQKSSQKTAPDDKVLINSDSLC